MLQQELAAAAKRYGYDAGYMYKLLYIVHTVKNLVASSHQIWCASVVPTGTPSEVCQSHLSF